MTDVANLMNNRPRKTLGWRTPAEAIADEIAAFKSTVALDVWIKQWIPSAHLCNKAIPQR
jgi:hypothetical protein